MKHKKMMTLRFMQMTIKHCFLILILTVVGFNVAAQSNSMVVDKIIAKVDNNIILKSELEQAYLQYISSGEVSAGSNTKCQILESLVINKLMVAKAEIDSVVVSNEEVNSNLTNRMNVFISRIGSEEKIEEYYGKTIEQFKDELREQVREQLIVQRMQTTITSDISVTPAEVKKFFNTIPSDSLPYFSTEVSLAQIVKLPTVSKTQKDVVTKKLLDLREQIVNGADFEELARKHSEEPAAASTGGNLGFQNRGDLVPAYEAAALKLKPGEISQPVETEFGFHLIQMIERRGNLYHTRHILMKPSSSELDIEEAKEYLDSIRTLILNDSIKFENAAKEFSDDKETAASGGFFLDGTGSPRISVEELEPTVFFTVDTMKVGTITKPIPYRTNDGKEAVRILYYESRIRPHQASLKEDYQKIARAAENEKKNLILNGWFDKAKDDVFIQIDPEYTNCKIME